MMEDLRDTLGVLLEADVGAADRDAVAGFLRQSRELRSWLDSFDVRCVRRTSEVAVQGRSEPAESMGTDHGLSARESRLGRLRAEACGLFVLFERALLRSPADPTAPRGDDLVAMHVGEHPRDVLAFDEVQIAGYICAAGARGDRRVHRLGRHRRGQVAFGQDVVLGEHARAFEGVA